MKRFNIYPIRSVYPQILAGAPTGVLELVKLKEQAKMDRQIIENLQDCVKNLEANRDLKDDKDFLLSQIKGAPGVFASTSK